MRARPALLPLLVLLAAGSAGAATLSGVVHTQDAVSRAHVAVWAVGAAVAADPELALAPLAERDVVPGEPFALELEAAPPFRVHAAAEGHAGAAIDVLFLAQLRLPAVWLPRATTVTVRVAGSGGAAAGAVVSLSRSVGDPGDGIGGHWSPRTVVVAGKDGTAQAAVAKDAWLAVTALGREGAWGAETFEAPLPGELAVRLDSRPVQVRVLDERGKPVAGARMAAEDAPVGATAVTGEDGIGTVQADVDGVWALLVDTPAGLTRRVLRGAPAGRLEIVAEPAEPLRVRWSGAAAVAVDAGWLPRALTGGAPAVMRGGQARLPFTKRRGTLTLWAPGTETAQVSVEERVPVTVELRPAPRVRGRLLGPDDEPVAGAPVWSWLVPPRSRAMMRRYGQVGMERAQRMPLPWAVTDGDGRFEVADLVSGPHRLTALVPGLPPAESDDLTLEAGATAEVTLRAVNGATVTATVVDPDGVPIAGVAATATVNRLERGRMVFRFGPDDDEEPVARGSSDQEGRLVLAGVPPRRLTLRLERSSFVDRTIDADVPAEGTDLGEVLMEPGVAVHGHVVDGQGNGVAGALVSVGSEGVLFGLPEARADAQGYFALEDRPRTGELVLEARAEGYVPAGPAKVAMPPEGIVDVRVRPALDLEGRVADRDSGDPVAGARLTLLQEVERTGPGGAVMMRMGRQVGAAESADDGTFVLTGLAPGEYTLAAAADSYRSRSLPVTLAAEERPRPLAVLLDTGLVIAGEVVDRSGAPVAGADVTVSAAESSTGMGRQGGARARSDDMGAFRAEGLAPGRYQVTARADGGRTARDVVEAGAGHVRLELAQTGAVEGRVLDADGAPVAAAELFAWGPDGRSATASADGSFRFPELSPGSYRVVASADGWAPDSAEVTVEEGRTANAELTLKRGGIVTGRVVGLSTADLEKCNVYGGGARTAPGPDGSFRLEGVRPGPVEVMASLLLAQRSRSVRTTVEADGPPTEVEIDFTAGASLSGTVRRRGRGVAGMTVTASSTTGRGSTSTITGERGDWQVSGLEPGTVEVAAADGRGRVLVGRTVEVEDHARVDLDIPGGELGGRVVESDTRRPVPGAEVTVTVEGSPRAERATLTGEDGAFAVADLPDGTAAVRASATGYMVGEASTAVSMGQAPDVVLELRPEQGLELLLREADGLPAGEVYVIPMRGGQTEEPVWARCDRDGRVRITSLPAGDYVLGLTGRGGAIVRAGVPGPEQVVALQPMGRLDVFTPQQDGWRVLMVTAAGLPVPQHPYRSPTRDGWIDSSNGRVTLGLPAGVYTVRAVGPGETRSEPVTVPAGGEVALRLD